MKLKILGYKGLLLIIIPVIMLILFYLRGKQIFEYDSDGETLIFKNRSIISPDKKNNVDEFPKYKLMDYNIVNSLFFRKLYITVFSKKNNKVVLKYDISYLTNKELSDLKVSLRKVLSTNKENQAAKAIQQ